MTVTKLLTGGLGLKVVGFFVPLSGRDPKATGLLVGFGFNRIGVVLSQGDFVLVTKLGSVVTVQDWLVQESNESEISFHLIILKNNL